MGVTLKQIAEELGVSQPLVTYALNGKPGVSEPMRLKIQETAIRMGYDKHANREAQMMIAKRYGRRIETGTIAVIYRHATSEDRPWSSSPFYRSLLDGVEHETGRRGLDLLITPIRDKVAPRIIRERRVDGLVFMTSPAPISAEIQALDVPCALLCSHSELTYNLAPDDEAGGYLATKHLIDLGHRDIAFVGMGRKNVSATGRRKGYERALTEHGIPVRENLIQTLPNVQLVNGREGLEALLAIHRAGGEGKAGFTGLVCQNDVVGMGAIKQAQEAGLRVPDDLSVVGFDDLSSQYDFQPLLTSVGYSRFDIGRRSIEWICQEVKALVESGEKDVDWKPRLGEEKFETKLAIHGSTRALSG
jgi:LacI family transcriptional regulator